jgi:hypothetical protein
MLHYEYLVLCPCISGISDLHYYFISFVGGLQGIWTLKISGAMTFRPSVQFSWMNLYCEFYDGRQGLEVSALNLIVILMYTDGFEPPMTEGRQYSCLINKCTK